MKRRSFLAALGGLPFVRPPDLERPTKRAARPTEQRRVSGSLCVQKRTDEGYETVTDDPVLSAVLNMWRPFQGRQIVLLAELAEQLVDPGVCYLIVHNAQRPARMYWDIAKSNDVEDRGDGMMSYRCCGTNRLSSGIIDRRSVWYVDATSDRSGGLGRACSAITETHLRPLLRGLPSTAGHLNPDDLRIAHTQMLHTSMPSLTSVTPCQAIKSV